MLVLRYIADSFPLLVTLIGMGIIIAANFDIDSKVSKVVIVSGVLLLLLSITTYIDQYVTGMPQYRTLRTAAAVFGYCLRPMLLLFFLYSILTDRKQKWFCIGLVVVNTLVYLSAFFVPYVFYMDENNQFQSPHHLNYFAYLTCLILLMMLVRVSIKYFGTKKSGEGKLLFFCAVSIFLAAVIESVTGKLNPLNNVIAISLCFYFLYAYISRTRRDAVTGLLNRQSFYSACRRNERRITAIISMDMNELKWINDNQGHKSGDIALRLLSECFEKNAIENGEVFRIGGDEFCEICYSKTEDEVRIHLAELRRAVEELPCSCAMGYAMKRSGDSIDDVCREADDAMYENKQEMKRQAIARGETLHLREQRLIYFRAKEKN